MTKLRKISGNYRQVIGYLGLPPGFCFPLNKEAYAEQIEKDLKRTPYLSLDSTVSQIQTQLRNTDPETPRSLTQGDLDGGLFNESYFTDTKKYHREMQTAVRAENKDGYFGTMRFAYIDDKGISSAFAVSYLRDDEDPSIPVMQRKRTFMISIIKNTTGPLDKREVSVYSHLNFLNSKIVKHGKPIGEDVLFDDMVGTLDCAKLKPLLTGMIQGDSLSMEHFSALFDRIRPGRNIDHRDFKQAKLDDLLTRFETFLPGNVYCASIRKQAADDINFFKKWHF